MLELNTEHDRALSSAAYYNKILLQVIMSELSSLSIFLLHLTQAKHMDGAVTPATDPVTAVVG